jgi:dienelactone hydrolase
MRTRNLWLLIFLITANSALSPVKATAETRKKHEFSMADWVALGGARATAISGQGTVLYHRDVGTKVGPTRTEWWIADTSSDARTKLSVPDGFSPVGFTFDGRCLYGLWKVDGRAQLALFPVDSANHAAAITVLTHLPRGVVSATASPDGRRFAMIADPRTPDDLDKIRHVMQPSESGIYVANADGSDGGWWCSGIDGISELPAWSRDGQSLAALSALPRIGHHNLRTEIDICTQHGSRHVADVPNVASDITWVDGGQLAFLSTKTHVQTPEHIWTVSAEGGEAIDRMPHLRGTVMTLGRGTHDTVWAVVEHGVQNDIEEFDDGVLRQLYNWPNGVVIGSPHTIEYESQNDSFAVSVGDPEHTVNVAKSEEGHLRKITDEGDSELADVELGLVKVVHWKDRSGKSLEGIVTFPAGFKEGTKYPLLILPHGGPEANDELRFDSTVRAIAGLGYVVLQPEYRGSTGYGSEFLEAIFRHFGDRPYQDVNSAADFAISEGWADPRRLALFGWSAGGFITDWVITQTSRYRAAIAGGGISDWESFVWTSDIQQLDFDDRWTDERPEVFRRFSPIAYAKNVSTPLLILHGEADQRIPIAQSLQMFQLLSARGKTVRMVSYAASPHFPELAEQWLNVMQELENWLSKYNRN